MQTIDTLIHARWVIPIEPDNQALEYHSVAIAEGKIIAVCPSQQARDQFHAQVTHERLQHALLPGLINAHTHASMTLMRGIADDLPLKTWLNDHIWPTEMKWVAPEFVHDGARLAVAEMLLAGTTCFADMYFFSDAVARVCQETHIRSVLGLILVDFPTPYAQTIDEYFHKGLKLHDDLRSHDLITTAFAPHAPYSVGDPPLARLKTLNNELNLPVHMHVHETAAEVEEAQARDGIRPLVRLQRHDLVNPNLVAVHMTQLKEDEIAMVAESGAHIVHCPESNLKLASGFCPVAKLVRAGINVALGTDGAASNNDLDLLAEMRTAALLAKAVAEDATALPAISALRMATLNGAKAFGLEERIGSLTPGKEADVIAIDLGRPATQPVYDPISQIVYSANRDQVSDSWIAGRQVLSQHTLLTIDEALARERAAAWRDKIVGAKSRTNEDCHAQRQS